MTALSSSNPARADSTGNSPYAAERSGRFAILVGIAPPLTSVHLAQHDFSYRFFSTDTISVGATDDIIRHRSDNDTRVDSLYLDVRLAPGKTVGGFKPFSTQETEFDRVEIRRLGFGVQRRVALHMAPRFHPYAGFGVGYYYTQVRNRVFGDKFDSTFTQILEPYSDTQNRHQLRMGGKALAGLNFGKAIFAQGDLSYVPWNDLTYDLPNDRKMRNSIDLALRVGCRF